MMDTVADVDEALARLVGDQNRVADHEAWSRWVDRLLDRRTLIAASNVEMGLV